MDTYEIPRRGIPSATELRHHSAMVPGVWSCEGLRIFQVSGTQALKRRRDRSLRGTSNKNISATGAVT